MEEPRCADPAHRSGVAARTATAITVAMAFLALGLVLWRVSDALLIVFAGVLVGVLLHAARHGIARVTGLADRISLALAVLGFAVLVALTFWAAGPPLVAQASRLVDDLPAALERLRQRLLSVDAVEGALQSSRAIDLMGLFPDPIGLLGGATTVVSSTFGGLATVILIAFFGVYFAAEPRTYAIGVTRLLPRRRRARARRVLLETALVLQRWLLGKLLTMTVIGVASYVGLLALGVPLALILAVVAALTAFIPYLGPLLGAAPMTLVALAESWSLALSVIGLYVAIQAVESYLLTPVIQSRAVDLPPAVVIAAQVFLGVLFGAFGLALATPLAASASIAVRRLYLEDVLGDR